MRRSLTLVLAVLTLATPVVAQDRAQIGSGRLFNNDIMGDGYDRWRTGSYVYSHVRGYDAYSGTEGFGELLELRFRTEIIAPQRGSAAAVDRPYVGAISLGAHTHFSTGWADVSLGGDLVAIGPQTGLSRFQEIYHETFDLPAPPNTDDQLADRFVFNGSASATKSFALGGSTVLRPFVEGLTGTEDLLRAGADVLVGPVATGNLLLRDVVTGQLYTGTNDAADGVSYVFGADITSVFDSDFLPSDQGYAVVETRTRARAGVHWQISRGASLFYGATYLSEEFEGQTEGQVVGSLKLNFNF